MSKEKRKKHCIFGFGVFEKSFLKTIDIQNIYL